MAEARIKSGRCIFRLQNRLDQIETAFFARERLPVDQAFAGPAIILQSDSTTVVPPGHSVVVEPSGNMIIRIEARHERGGARPESRPRLIRRPRA